jgi:hypothetical protein
MRSPMKDLSATVLHEHLITVRIALRANEKLTSNARTGRQTRQPKLIIELGLANSPLRHRM